MSLSAGVITLIDEFVGVAARSGTRLTALFEPRVYNLSSETTETLRFSDGRYATDSGHTPASTLWQPRFELPSFRASLGFEAGAVGHAGTIRVGGVTLFNQDGALDDYLDESAYAWEGQVAELLLGGHDWDRANFDVIVSGTIASLSFDTETISIQLDSAIPELNRSFASVLYGGFAGALEGDGAATYAEVGDEYDIGDGDFTVEFVAKWPNLSTLMAQLQKRNSFTTTADAGWSAHVTASDELQFSVSDGTTGATITAGSAGEYDDDARHMVSYVFDRTADELRAYVDGVADATPVSTTGIGGVRTSNPLRFFRRSTAGAYFDGVLDEIRIWSVARTADQIAANHNRALTGAEGADGLIGLFTLDEYGLVDSGATALNNVEGPTLNSVILDTSGEEISWGNNKDQTTGDFTFGIWLRPSSSDTGTSWMLGKRNDTATGSAGWGMHVNASNNVVVEISDGTNEGSRVHTSYDVRDGRWYAAVAVVNRTSDTLDISLRHAGGAWQRATQQDISAVTGSLTNALNFRAGRDGGGTNQFLGQFSHAFIVLEAMAVADAEKVMDGAWTPPDTSPTEDPAIDDAAAKAGTGYWPMDEGTGTTITDNVGSINGTASAGVTWQDRDADVTSGTWVSSLEGGKELMGSPKPLCLGRVKDAPGILVESIVDRIVQFNTPDYGTSEEVEAARVDGLLMTEGALNDYVVDLTASTLDVDNANNGQITIDIKGLIVSSVWLRRTGALANWVLNTTLGATMESGTADALDLTYPYEVGLYLRSEEYLTREILAALFQAGREAEGARGRLWWSERFGGSIRLGALKDVSGETPALSITDAYIADGARGVIRQTTRPPVWKVLVGWQRVWHEFREFLGSVTEDEQARMSAKYRWAEEASPAIKDQYPNARVLKLPSLIYREADAKLEAKVLFDLFSVPRPVYSVQLVRSMFQVEIGDVVQVTTDRLGFDSGKLFQVIGYDYSLGTANSAPRATVELWGGF